MGKMIEYRMIEDSKLIGGYTFVEIKLIGWENLNDTEIVFVEKT